MSIAESLQRSEMLKKRWDMRAIAPIVLAGGVGTRLFPLTLSRCKPALPFGGKSRLIDIPLANALAAGCEKIYVVTQFLSTSLHRHLIQSYPGIELLTAEQKPSKSIWYQGTADAVRQNLEYLSECDVKYFLILSGDQVYQMDFEAMAAQAEEKDADLLVASLPVGQDLAQKMGLLKINSEGQITDFCEKPSDPAILNSFSLSSYPQEWLGSMGIYLFKKEALIRLLKDDPREDFGKHLIPEQVKKGQAFTYIYSGYWEDVGTIRSFHEANMALTMKDPCFDLYSCQIPMKTLPPPKIYQSTIDSSLIGEGTVLDHVSIKNSILGPRTCLGQDSVVSRSYFFGNSLGKACIIKNAIIDKNVKIGNGVHLENIQGLESYDGDGIYIREGIIIVARGAIIPDGFTL